MSWQSIIFTRHLCCMDFLCISCSDCNLLKNAAARIIKFTRENDHIILELYVQNPFGNLSFKMAF